MMRLGLVSREASMRWRGRLAGAAAEAATGAVLVTLGVLMLTGLDETVEAAAAAATPDWLNTRTARY